MQSLSCKFWATFIQCFYRVGRVLVRFLESGSIEHFCTESLLFSVLNRSDGRQLCVVHFPAVIVFFDQGKPLASFKAIADSGSSVFTMFSLVGLILLIYAMLQSKIN